MEIEIEEDNEGLQHEIDEVFKGEDEIEVNVDADEVIYGQERDLTSTPHFANLVEFMLEDEELRGVLSGIGVQVAEAAKADLEARRDRDDQIVKGLNELGLRIEESNTPFTGACTASHPLVIENALKFQAKAISEIFPPNGPVKVQILGPINQPSVQRAERIKLHMNWQATTQMPEYFDEKENVLLSTALIGSGFTKSYWNPMLNRPVVEEVPYSDFIVPPDARNLRTSPRITHRLFYDAKRYQDAVNAGYLSPLVDLEGLEVPKPLDTVQEKINELRGVKNSGTSEDDGYIFYEQFVYLQLEAFGDQQLMPYIVTVESSSEEVVRLQRAWEEEDPTFQRIDVYTQYKFAPGFDFYGLGLISLLGNLSKTVNTALRALVDSGQFANLQGGFRAKGIKTYDNSPIPPGTWREVEATGMDLSKALYPIPYKEPSQTLRVLMTDMVAAGQKFADSTDQVVADSTNYGPVGTTLALLDASTKFFSAIHKRLHNAQKNELGILYRLNQKNMPDQIEFGIPGQGIVVTRADYMDPAMAVIPVSDPNVSSQAHRVAMNTMLYQVTKENPQLLNMREVLRRSLLDLNISEPEKLFNNPEEAQQLDPLSDLMAVSQGKPIKAFPGQDHNAHIAVKSAWLQDPLNGGNPVYAQIAPLVTANVREHMILNFSEQMQGLTAQGMVEAEAAKQILQANQAASEDGDTDAEMMKAKAAQQKVIQDGQAKGAQLMLEAAKVSQKDRELDLKEQELVLKAGLEVLDTKVAKDHNDNTLQLEAIRMVKDAVQADKKLEADLHKTRLQAKKKEPAAKS